MNLLPVALEPNPDESWRSYLDRVARFYRCTTESLGTHLGLRPNNQWPTHHGIFLDPALTSQASAMLGITCAQITNMHLARWDGRALQVAAITGQSRRPWPVVPLSWTFLNHPRTCDACLAKYGYHRLTWHLPWVTHCVEHSVQLRELGEATNAPSDGAQRTALLLNLLTAPIGVFAGEVMPAATALRAWLECAILTAAAEHPDWRTPPTAQTAHRWLSCAAPIATATTAQRAEELLKPIIRNPQVRAGRYAQASLYSPPMRNLIDSVHARWNRALPPEPKPRPSAPPHHLAPSEDGRNPMNLDRPRQPRNRAMQRKVRARMAETGESYQQALQTIRAKIEPPDDDDLPPAA